jgi:hypothetical protein
MGLWFYDSSKQALICFDPERNGQGIGFHIPAIERIGYWRPFPGLELAIRASIPRMPGPSMIQPASAIPNHGIRR